MAVNHLEATLQVCYCPTRTLAHELMVIWPIACLAWLPCTQHQLCKQLSHEGISVGPLELLNGSQSLGSYFTRLLLPYKVLRARTFGFLTYCYLAWLPCTEHQSCEHLSHDGTSVGPLELINCSQSLLSYFTGLLLPYKDLRARTFGNLACCVPSLATMHRTSVL